MPLTAEQKERARIEGSLRRRFDHYITSLGRDQLDELDGLWGWAEQMLSAVLQQSADVDEALRRSATWLAAGSPSHRFSEPGERWCRVCGCGAEGFQHQGGTGK